MNQHVEFSFFLFLIGIIFSSFFQERILSFARINSCTYMSLSFYYLNYTMSYNGWSNLSQVNVEILRPSLILISWNYESILYSLIINVYVFSDYTYMSWLSILKKLININYNQKVYGIIILLAHVTLSLNYKGGVWFSLMKIKCRDQRYLLFSVITRS